jgi:hypothetical protein
VLKVKLEAGFIFENKLNRYSKAAVFSKHEIAVY